MLKGGTPPSMIFGLWNVASLPAAAANGGRFVVVTDDPVTGEALYYSDGNTWQPNRSAVNADWNAVSGLAQVLNKPTIPTAVQAATLTTDSSGSVTWTYPSAYGAAPVVEAVAVASAGTTDVLNVQLDGAPTATQAKFKVTRTQQSVVALLGLTILSIPTSVGSTVIHAIAKAVGL